MLTYPFGLSAISLPVLRFLLQKPGSNDVDFYPPTSFGVLYYFMFGG